jgi:mannose-6-phosphate isomerase-like protein (cupin superfamily)
MTINLSDSAQTMEEEHRPWGYYSELIDEETHKVKRIFVNGRNRLSLQRHQHRTEHWYVIEGMGLVTRDDEEITLKPGQAVDIRRGSWHRMSNPGESDLVFIEVQTGDYFGEDDIERREDDYGRV